MAKIIDKRNLAGPFWLIKLQLDDDFLFQPGQYVSVKVAEDGSRRSYSIASSPDGKTLELLVDVAPMGLGSKFFLATKVGELIEILGPIGIFKVSPPKYGQVLFVATGSGIVPFKPMIKDLLEKQKFGGKVILQWGMRHEKDLFWIEEFKAMREKYPNFIFDVVLSQPEGEWLDCSGHVEDCLTKHNESWAGWESYICGNQKMIMEVGGLVQKMGMKLEDVHFEKFF